jgi:hypothetical protein
MMEEGAVVVLDSKDSGERVNRPSPTAARDSAEDESASVGDWTRADWRMTRRWKQGHEPLALN